VKTHSTWLCPFKRRICDCRHCSKHYHWD